MQKEMKKMSKLRNFVPALVGISLIFLMVHLAGTGEIVEAIRKAAPFLLLVAVSLEFVSLTLWAIRWKILLRPFKSVSLKSSLIGIFIGTFFNNITPMYRAGGEPFRAYFMESREKVSFEDAFATVTVDHILDAIPFLVIILGALVYFLFFARATFQMITIIILAFLLNLFILSVVLFFSFNLKAAKKLVFAFFAFVAKFSTALEKYRDRAEGAVERYNKAMKMLSSRRDDLTSSLAVSFLFWFILILRSYLVMRALYPEVDFMAIVVAQVVGILVGMLPLLPGGIASVEGTTVFLYLSFGFPSEIAVSACLLDRLISFWFMTALGAFFVVLERKFLE